MISKELKPLAEQYLRYKYEYYILCEPTISDSEFDLFEDKLRKLELEEVVDIVDFPTIKEIEKLGLNPKNIVGFDKIDDTKYPHFSPMLSIQKLQVNDEENMPYDSYQLFLDKITSDYIEGGSKYDGNGVENNYKNGKLFQSLTRGTKTHGLDKTNKMKYLIPNNINLFKDKIVEIRGEVVIDVKIWQEKYSNPDKPDNPRNYVAGVLRNEKFSLQELNDLTYVAYSLVLIDEQTGKKEYPDNSMELLEELGFNQKYKPLILKVTPDINGFNKLYNTFKKYREECPFLLDGIVAKFPESKRNKLGEQSHHPYWCIAIKFPSQEVSTYINDVTFHLGTDGNFCPKAILEPVELLGTMVTKATLSNLGNMIRKGLFPGAKVYIQKSGEIIPYITGVLEKSPQHDEYMEMILEKFKKFNINI